MMTLDKDALSIEEALTLVNSGSYERCERVCDRLIQRSGDADAIAIRALARAFRGLYEEALCDLQGALDRPTPSRYAFYALAKTHHMMGHLDKALAFAESAIERAPHIVRLDLFRTELYIDSGRYEEAHDALQQSPCARADATSCKATELTEYARLLAIVSRRLGRPGEALPALDRALDDAGLSDLQRQSLLFEKGASLDALGRYDEAFEAVSAANGLERERIDPLLHKDAVDRTIRYWSPSSFASIPCNRDEDARRLFLVGMPRSGSTLLDQMLDCHSAISSVGEGPWLLDAAKPIEPYNAERYGTIVDPRALDGDRLRQVALSYRRSLDRLEPRRTGIVADKTLSNHKLVGLIAKVFPKAVIVWCQRNPLDTIFSCYFQGFSHNAIYSRLPDITKLYHDSQRLLKHWRDGLDIPILEVGYEDVVADPRAQIERILDRLGLAWEDACLAFHSSKRFARTASKHQVNQPIYRSSAGRWKHYEKQLEHVKLMLSSYGYL